MLQRLTLNEYEKGLRQGDKNVLSKAITLIESTLGEDQEIADQLLENVFDSTGNSIRIGITGVPGVGKSTFIEAFGSYLTSIGRKVAVLTVDPSSQRTKGSILGDKTRMNDLSRDKHTFIRSTPAGDIIGGVSGKTRETMLVCEVAGFDTIIVETVGVGQSETDVYNMVDFCLLLALSGAGDELQGIKRGIMEIADAIIITKADGNNSAMAQKAKISYQNALHLFAPNVLGYTPTVLTTSALEKTGITETWGVINDFVESTSKKGFLSARRKNQNQGWFWKVFNYELSKKIEELTPLKQRMNTVMQQIKKGKSFTGGLSRKFARAFIDSVIEEKKQHP